MTFSNRITLAGAIPLLVAAALAVLVAAIALAPLRPASAVAGADACKISPVILDMLLKRYGKAAAECDDLNLNNPGDLAEGMVADTWDLSGKNLSSFAVTNDDAKYLKAWLGADADTPSTRITEPAVRYIDLTGNPLTVADVDFKHIPSNVAIKLTADSNIKGFQQADYTVTEGAASYISAAFPDLITGTNTVAEVTVTLTGDVSDDVNEAIQRNGDADKIELVSYGTSATDFNQSTNRTFPVDTDSSSVILYWPITVSNDNENDDEWDITLTINETTGFKQAATVEALGTATANEVSLAIDSANVTIVDADEPVTTVCDRSEDVEESILTLVSVSGQEATYGGIPNNPRDCDELTKRDLSKISQLWVADEDTDDREPLETLQANDFADLTGVYRLHIVGARSLPSGIFAGVGKRLGVRPRRRRSRRRPCQYDRNHVRQERSGGFRRRLGRRFHS